MNRDNMIDALAGIDDDLIQTVDALRTKKRRPVWLKWGALAACLCLLVTIAVPVIRYKGGFGSQGPDDDIVGQMALLYYQGALYECCTNPQALERLGLPAEITPDLAGAHVANIEMGGNPDYQECVGQTDKELLEYAPAPSRAVYILRDGDTYMAVVFCRTFFPDNPKAYTDLAEVYRFYNIEDSDDIVSLTQVDWYRGKITGAEITDAEITDADAIADFYALTTDISNFVSMDNDAFQDRVFGDVPEENAPEAHTDFADDLKVIRIETADGHRFFVSVYPSYGYVYSGQAMAYHLITKELAQWFAEHFSF